MTKSSVRDAQKTNGSAASCHSWSLLLIGGLKLASQVLPVAKKNRITLKQQDMQQKGNKSIRAICFKIFSRVVLKSDTDVTFFSLSMWRHSWWHSYAQARDPSQQTWRTAGSEKNNKVSDCINQEIRAAEVLPQRKDRTVLILLCSSFPHCHEWFTKVGATALNHISIFLVPMLASLVFSFCYFLFPSNANWSLISTQVKNAYFMWQNDWLKKRCLPLPKNKESHINAKNYFALRFSRVGDTLPPKTAVVAYWLWPKSQCTTF